MEWIYESLVESSNGYEDTLDLLKSYKSEIYKTLPDSQKEQWINEVFDIYRGKNIFPIVYLNKDGCVKDIKKCIDKEVSFNNNTLDLKLNQGQTVCKFLFPNLFTVKSQHYTTMEEKFFNDHYLKKSIKLCFDIKKGATPSELFGAFGLVSGNMATNFKPMVAKALYERYCPKDGVIYDFSSGFGGRMLGALSSKNNYKYIGCEPCVETFKHLNELGEYIELATNRTNIFKLYNCGSEEINTNKQIADFAFSSPPYFNLEKYSDEDTQCYNKYRTLDEWFDGYVEPTIKNTYDILKDNTYYAVNISDFNVGKKRVEFVDKWIELSSKIGFEYIEKIDMKLSTRKGDGHKNENGNDREKKEGIFIFKKR